MIWFEGSIPAAIASAKQLNSIFVVVISGDDEQSAQMLSSWEDDRVNDATHNRFVAIKVDATSETCVQFSQIYPVVCIPSSFFIGENGIPLEVVAGSISAEDLIKRIDKVLQMHAQQIASLGEVPPVAEGQTEAPSSPIQATDLGSHPPTPQEPLLAQSSAATTEKPTVSVTTKESLSRPAEESSPPGHMTPGEERGASLGSQHEEGLDAKVERLTKKLEERREQRKKGEDEGEVQKEVERRKHGKEMLEYKRKHEDDKARRIVEERNREKAEEKAARERVKQQIAQDRADRAARYAKNQEELDAARAAALQARQTEQELKKEVTQKERSAIARIQFRLPDGSSFTNTFPSEARLQEARQFVAQEVGNRYGHFSLATMFPRREFTGEDMEKTFLELELAPSASIVLLPQTGRPANSVVQSSEGGLWAFLGTILYPLLAVWRFLSGFLFSSPPTPGTGPRASLHRPPTATASTTASTSSASGEPKRESIRKRVLEKRPEDFKKDGKIYRLRTQDDSEDENNTWNGNSTQQM